MSDEQQIEVRPLAFTQYVALCIDEWPPAIELTEEWLKRAYQYGATVEGDTLKFVIGNGAATYRLHRDRQHGRGFVAELVVGNEPANLKARRKKFEVAG